MATNQIDTQDLKAIVMAVLYAGQENPTLSDVDARADVIMGLARPRFAAPLVDLDDAFGDTPIERVAAKFADEIPASDGTTRHAFREPAGIKNVLRDYSDERQAPIGQDDAYTYQTNFSTLRHARIKAVWLVSDGSQIAFERGAGTPIVFEVQNGKLTQTNAPKVLAGSSLIRVI